MTLSVNGSQTAMDTPMTDMPSRFAPKSPPEQLEAEQGSEDAEIRGALARLEAQMRNMVHPAPLPGETNSTPEGLAAYLDV